MADAVSFGTWFNIPRLAGGAVVTSKSSLRTGRVIEQLPHEELIKMMAFLKHRLRAENPEYQRELARRHADIEAGRGISLTEAKKRMAEND